NGGEVGELLAIEPRAARGVYRRCERPDRARGDEGVRRALAQTFHAAQAEPDRAHTARPRERLRAPDVDGQDAQRVALRVLDDRRRVVEAHWLVVEQRRVELRGMVKLQIGAGVGEQGEAGRV